ncbi:hypothetical protein AAG570_009016 [Ranatra chinensis]|uniref:Exonuclease domain-containing protein n=1 Tax=Ranatra chinensis TaxID=642074 RepID=A0ABD0YSJ2_9HEMI
MTGLDPETDHILEVACIITDGSLEVVARGPELIIHQPKKILDSMNSWCKEQHSKTGLIEASLNSKISVLDAENQLLDFVTKYTPPGKCPLGGNSVYMDKMFIMKYFPRVSSHCHYRLIDVSTIKELCRFIKHCFV